MRAHYLIFALGALPVVALAQAADGRFLMDAPGPGYRQMRGDITPTTEVKFVGAPLLSLRPNEINRADLFPLDGGNSQIFLTLRDDTAREVRAYLEFNRARPIRVEIGDYTLPVDFGKTLPWTTGIWLQARPTPKAKTILEALSRQK